MKVSELRGGQVHSVDLRPESGVFDPLPVKGDELGLLRVNDEVVVLWGDQKWPVVPYDAGGQAALAASVDSGLTIVAWAAQVAVDRLTARVHAFPVALTLPDRVDIGVDERIVDDVRRNFKRGGTALQLAAWLTEEALFDGGAQTRAVVAPDARGELHAFRIFGRRLAIDVKLEQNHYRVVRVTRGGRIDRGLLTLLHAPLAFVDATAASAAAIGARMALDEAVRSQDSYLRIWVEYNRLETDAILRRARRFGAVAYERATRRTDGGWRFALAAVEDLAEPFRRLGDDDRVELEAAERRPDFKDLATPSADEPLVARIVALDLSARTLDLAAPDDDDESPTPPRAGFLFVSTRGDRTRLRRRERAEAQLRTGTCPMPWLGLLLEGRPSPRPTWRRREPWSAAVRAAFSGRPTAAQTRALDVALNTPDIALIQGPPGTGKTRVITALQRRIAELADEGVEASHRILVTSTQHDAVETVAQRTVVFGLPAVKIGARRRDDGAGIDGVERFRADRIEHLQASLRALPDDERGARARRAAIAVLRAPCPPRDTARQLFALLDAVEDLLPPGLADRLRARAHTLERTSGPAADPELHEQRLGAARGLSVLPGAFLDGGPRRARKAFVRLADLLSPPEAALLERCAEWTDEEHAPPWLDLIGPLRDALIDRLAAAVPPALTRDEATQSLLRAAIDELDRRRRVGRASDEAALAGWLHDLEHDPLAVREALEHYTVVLAATLQQAAGEPMRAARGVDTGGVSFETVIVDEAARANPLDLFIPLTMARRRVVLVGDHRQLPHMLEPDVERDLAEQHGRGEIGDETVEAVRRSLFQRLWDLLGRLEAEDGVPRRVTLDTQFRMHPVLGEFVSRVFYERRGDPRVASGSPAAGFVYDLPGYMRGERPVVAGWIDVPGGGGARERGVRGKSRPVEARRLAHEVERLLAADPALTFGVIAFYRDQVTAIGEAFGVLGLAEPRPDGGWQIVERLRRTTNAAGEVVERLRLGTVDAFQGKEFDVVLLSVTRSNDRPGETDAERRLKYGHLMFENRLCVAMSRQHRLLIAVGDLAFIRAATPLEPLREFIALCEGDHGVVHD